MVLRGAAASSRIRARSNLWNMEHPYLLPMRSDAGETFYRLRGLGLINDPNDFGQVVVCVIPLVFIFWRAKKTFRNVCLCSCRYVCCSTGCF